MNDLKDLGWDDRRQGEFEQHNRPGLQPFRVASATNGRFWLIGWGEPAWAVLRGRLLDPDDTDDLPAVGDWVLARDEGQTRIIEKVLARRSRFVRKSAGVSSKTQVIAANVDRVFIVTTAGEDFSPRRIERYLAAVWDGGAEPVIVINKIDRPHDRDELLAELDGVAFGVTALFVSAHLGEGQDELFALCEPGKTIALVGSSGVGKSSLINRLLGQEIRQTHDIREKDERGRHTTTRKELIVTAQGALLIDTPGMREFGLAEPGEGLDRVFADLLAYAENCRFRDCTHDGEPGCAVREAVDRGELSAERLDSFHRLQKELAYNARRSDQREMANVKRRWKTIAKAIREIYPKKS